MSANKVIKFLWEQPFNDESEDGDALISEMEETLEGLGFEWTGSIVSTRIEDVE